jgi:hypothetical protein
MKSAEERKVATVRLPADAFAWLDRQVALYGSSQSSEVLRLIRERQDAEQRREVR